MPVNVKQLRKIHRTLALTTILPFGIILLTGILLLFLKTPLLPSPNMKAFEEINKSEGIFLTYDKIFELAKSVPETEIHTWKDIDDLRLNYQKGLITVRSKNRYQIIINGQSGEILDHRYRLNSLLISLHQGSFFGSKVPIFVYLPFALCLFFLWLGGGFLLAKMRKTTR